MGFLSKLFGGGGKTKVVTQTKTEQVTNYDISPKTEVALEIDTEQIGEGLKELAESNREVSAQQAATLTAVVDDIERLVVQGARELKGLLIAAGAGLLLYKVLVKR